ncbi:MAG TPA: CHAP domain-containing protein, partial [Trebonia sp.]
AVPSPVARDQPRAPPLISPGAWAVLLAILARMLLVPPVAVPSGLPAGLWPAGSPAGARRAAPASYPGAPALPGYPYAGATCEFGAAGGPQCVNPRDSGDLYDWGYAGPAGQPFRPSDPWGYEYRNCTSYVAWRLARAGVPASLFRDLGNASQWIADVAGKQGVVVNRVPAPGAIAVWVVSAGVGHVAWADSVRPGATGVTVTVSDYNYDGTGTFATHVLASPPTAYIHFPGA